MPQVVRRARNGPIHFGKILKGFENAGIRAVP